MFKSYNRYLSVALLLFVAGCVGTQKPKVMTQTQIRSLETRDIDASYEKTYDAALNAMFSMGLQIEHTDKASGIITGQQGDPAQRAVLFLFKCFYKVKKVTLMITPKSANVTMIRMKVLINEKPQTDERLMTEIWQRIEREALLTEVFSISESDTMTATQPTTCPAAQPVRKCPATCPAKK